MSRGKGATTRVLLGAVLVPLVAVCATTTSTLNPEGGGPPAVTFPFSGERVYSAALSVVSLLSWELTHSEREAGLIQAQTPRNFLTDGDQVMIRLTSVGDPTRVDISSTTRQAIDWGKNRENIEKFMAELEALLQGGGRSASALEKRAGPRGRLPTASWGRTS